MRRCLIVGGTKGLGFSLADRLARDGNEVIVTGREDPKQEHLRFYPLDLSNQPSEAITQMVTDLPHIDLLVYAAGFYQEGRVTDLAIPQIDEMLNVGAAGAVYLTRELLLRQGELEGFIGVTSTSQWTPREFEPVYTLVKAGLGAYANSLALDPRVQKTLVVGPAGMKTHFWEGTEKDTSGMLNPDWVAEQILALFNAGNFCYKFARILREPPRVEIVETR